MGRRRPLKLLVTDWLECPALSSCSPATRGIWFNFICAMHMIGRRGQLRGTAIQLAQLGRCSPEQVIETVDELGETGAGIVIKQGDVFVIPCDQPPLWIPQSIANRIRSWLANNRSRMFNLIALRDGKRCAYCRACCADLEIDHIRPVSKGGKNGLENLQLLCPSCNRRKSAKWEGT